jgi:predicted DsbA family dithiol-disulfide isomerase
MAEQMGIKIVLPKVSPQPHTHLAFEGYQYAKEHGKANEYNERMFTAFFQDELDIGNIEVLAELAGQLKLDAEDIRQALETGKYKEVHQNALNHAYREADITAVPTFVIGKQVLPGIRSKQSLERIIEQELEQAKRDAPLIEGGSCGIDGC